MELSMARKDLDRTPAMLDMLKMDGKVALIAGGTYGLGYAVAYRYLEAGACVVITGRNAEKGERAIAEFNELGFEGKIAFFQQDVQVVEQCYAAVDFTEKKFGRLDILANIAGWQKMYPFLDMPEAAYDMMLDTNLKGSFFTAQAAAKAMLRCGAEGYIVNCSSVSSLGSDGPAGMYSHYSISKAGVNAMTLALARELNMHNIHVNCVACGGMDTEGKQDNGAKLIEIYGQKAIDVMMQPKFRDVMYGDLPNSQIPDEMARMFFILSTPLARHMAGATVFVDGGLRIHSRMCTEDISNFMEELNANK